MSDDNTVENLTRKIEIQGQIIERLEESIRRICEATNSAIELAALSQKTAAESLDLSAKILRRLDELDRMITKGNN